MIKSKRKGYVVERKTRIFFEKNGWKVVRAGGSFGEADLVCIKNGICILFQVKSTKKPTFYYDGYMEGKFEGIPFYLIVDFGYGNIRVVSPKGKVKNNEGLELIEFLNKEIY